MATTTTRAAGLVAACDDSRLLAFPLWARQRSLLEAVELGPRLHVWALRRRSGKTTLSACVALWDCLLRPELDRHVRPGERRHAVAVATSIRQARLFVQAAVSIVEASPMLKSMIETVDEDSIMFKNQTALTRVPVHRSRSFGAGRSRRCCSMRPRTSSVTRTGLRSRSASSRVSSRRRRSSVTLRGSSSRRRRYGTSGMFAELHVQAAAGELSDAVAQHFTTEQVNPTITAEFLAREQARDPDNFRSEYLAGVRRLRGRVPGRDADR